MQDQCVDHALLWWPQPDRGEIWLEPNRFELHILTSKWYADKAQLQLFQHHIIGNCHTSGFQTFHILCRPNKCKMYLLFFDFIKSLWLLYGHKRDRGKKGRQIVHNMYYVLSKYIIFIIILHFYIELLIYLFASLLGLYK